MALTDALLADQLTEKNHGSDARGVNHSIAHQESRVL